MKVKILTIISLLAFLGACTKHKTEIHVLCEKGQQDSYTIKWEVYPEQDNALIQILASNNDTLFPSRPIKAVSANKYISEIENADSLGYSFFKLKIGNTYSDVITNRVHHFEDIQNFRDLGGYKTEDGKNIKWRKIFRSGNLQRMSEADLQKLVDLNIRTIINLRPNETASKSYYELAVASKFNVMLSDSSSDNVKEKVLEEKLLRGDAILYMQDMYEKTLIDKSKELAKLYDYMLEENNYPLVFHCSVGKDQSGLASYFLLRALGVSPNIAERDYLMSNMVINKEKVVREVGVLSEVQQEAYTILIRADKAFLKYGLSCIRRKYKSVDNYMEEELGLTKEKREKLREILLYK